MTTNLSLSLVNILYNFQLMHCVGENGVAAYGVIMYLNFVFISVFLGYCMGCAPVISFHYGAGNRTELKNLVKKSLLILTVCGILMTVLGITLSRPLSGIFVGYDAELLTLTQRGVMIYSLSFVLAGYNIFASAFFTALNNGVVSAAVSFLRTLVFQVAAVLTLLYLLAWLCSKKQWVGWLIFALVFFVLDTVGMLLSIVIATDMIIDILFHAWVIYYLILGIHAHFKLKKLPPDEEPAFFNGTVSQQMEGSTQTVAPVISEESNS